MLEPVVRETGGFGLCFRSACVVRVEHTSVDWGGVWAVPGFDSRVGSGVVPVFLICRFECRHCITLTASAVFDLGQRCFCSSVCKLS